MAYQSKYIDEKSDPGSPDIDFVTVTGTSCSGIQGNK